MTRIFNGMEVSKSTYQTDSIVYMVNMSGWYLLFLLRLGFSFPSWSSPLCFSLNTLLLFYDIGNDGWDTWTVVWEEQASSGNWIPVINSVTAQKLPFNNIFSRSLIFKLASKIDVTTVFITVTKAPPVPYQTKCIYTLPPEWACGFAKVPVSVPYMWILTAIQLFTAVQVLQDLPSTGLFQVSTMFSNRYSNSHIC